MPNTSPAVLLPPAAPNLPARPRLRAQTDVVREKAAFAVSSTIVESQGKNIDSKTWWLVRDNLRGQAYTMKANMLAINKQASNKAECAKAYAKFWKEIDSRESPRHAPPLQRGCSGARTSSPLRRLPRC